MIRVSLGAAREGMVLAREVEDRRGNVLARRGVVLNQGWIRALGSRGVEAVFVEDPQDAPEPMVGAPGTQPQIATEVPEEVASRCRAIDEMFTAHRGDPLMEQLAGFAKEYLEGKYGR